MHYSGSELFLMISGGIGILTLLVNLFLFIGDHPGKRWATALPPVNSDDFLFGLSRLVNVPCQKGGQVPILNNGDEFFNRLYEVLEAAVFSINFSVYIWEAGKISDRLFQILIQKAQAGVPVRLLLDGFGGAQAPHDWIKKFKEAGGIVARFRTPSLGRLWRLNRRNHRRAIIVDGKIGFTGGMAVGDKWGGQASKPDEWRDTMFEFSGAMAQSLQGVFAQSWAGTTGEILAGEMFYPSASDKNLSNTYISVASSPADDAQPLPVFYWFTISCAKKKLYAISPYAVPGRHMREAICQAAKSGVDVRLLLPNHLTDAHPIRLASHSFYGLFLESGVRIFEYQKARLHSKVLIADGHWSVIGSANLDIRSEERNEENIVGIADPAFAKQLEDIFMDDLKNSKEITGDAWRKRNYMARLFEQLFRIFIKQY